jgi:hypothetical protein
MQFRYFNKSEYLEYLFEGEWRRCYLRPCFPLKNNNNFLSIFDLKDNKEIDIIKNIETLARESKESVLSYMAGQKFSFQIENIESIIEDENLRFFEVKTQLGKRFFQTEKDDWPLPFSDGKKQRYQIIDLYGDVYEFVPMDLDKKSRRKVGPLIN